MCLVLQSCVKEITLPNFNNLTPQQPTTSNTQKNKVIVGAVCKDGTRSTATGSGACSYHGGVSYWIYGN